MKVGIVGAGIAGLSCAARLAQLGIAAELFDKGNRPGGRLSTLCLNDLAWDFGAQYFVPETAEFTAQTAAWEREGVVGQWSSGPTGAMVGTPGMSSLVQAMRGALDTRYGALVQRLAAHPDGWHLDGPDLAAGRFAAVATAVPAEQAAPLLALHDLGLAQEAASVRSVPCWSLMVAFTEPLPGVPDLISDRGSILRAVRNSSKPQRAAGECWVIQASPTWSLANLERDREEVAASLLACFAELTPNPLPATRFCKAHRWRYALPFGQPATSLWDERLRLGACGDWCGGDSIEGAWLSGRDLAEKIAATL